MRQLNIEGKKTTLSLTLEKANSMTESSIMSLELSDLRGENHISVKTVFSTPELPVTTINRATQEDINKWPHLSNIQIDQIHGEVGLLIGSDIPEVLEPKEIRSQDGSPYATRTIFGWVINGPLGRSSTTSCSTVNFVKAADVNLDKQFQKFYQLLAPSTTR